jgi:Zn-dependent peptidase ImmA (M78 family)
VWNCNRESITNPQQYDWTEWQAGWVSGAILMPASAIREWSAECASKFETRCPFGIESLPAADLIKTVVRRCDVSVLAARVRLKRLNLLNEPSASASKA